MEIKKIFKTLIDQEPEEPWTETTNINKEGRENTLP